MTIAPAFRYFVNYPGIALRTLRDPISIWWRLFDRAIAPAGPLVSRHQLCADPQWERHLHERLGVNWPCPLCKEFWDLWPRVMSLLESKGFRTGPESYFGWNDGDPELVRAIWCMVRHTRPSRVVETGVGHGVTSRFVLEALKRNEYGHLWSIDQHPIDPETAKQVGVAVDNCSPDRWTFIEGSSRHRLSPLLVKIGSIDVFVHDSLHTTKNVEFELKHGWAALREGGFVLVDDVDTNDGFCNFMAAHSTYPSMICQSEPIHPDLRRADQRGLFGFAQKSNRTIR